MVNLFDKKHWKSRCSAASGKKKEAGLPAASFESEFPYFILAA